MNYSRDSALFTSKTFASLTGFVGMSDTSIMPAGIGSPIVKANVPEVGKQLHYKVRGHFVGSGTYQTGFTVKLGSLQLHGFGFLNGVSSGTKSWECEGAVQFNAIGASGTVWRWGKIAYGGNNSTAPVIAYNDFDTTAQGMDTTTNQLFDVLWYGNATGISATLSQAALWWLN